MEMEMEMEMENGNGNRMWKWNGYGNKRPSTACQSSPSGYVDEANDGCSLSVPFVTETSILVAFSTVVFMSFEQVHNLC